MTVHSILLRIGRLIKKKQLKIFNPQVSMGPGVIIDYKTVVINKGNKITLGENVYIRSDSRGYQAGMPFPATLLTDVKNATISIGANTRIVGAYIHAQDSIVMGKNCLIASGVNILDSNGHQVYSLNRTVNRDKPEKIVLGDNVWVGINAIILKGTTIGSNSIVAAGSVVKGDFPDNTLIAGNPAKAVKTLDIK